MPYLITLSVISIWMIALLFRKKLSLHSIVAVYAIGVFTADMFEVSFNLLLRLYKFPTHLRTNPVDANEMGIVLADTLILPFALIVFFYYAAKKIHPWKITVIFAIGFTILEWIYVKLGYLQYLNWYLAYSAAFYVAGFRMGAYLAPRITSYNPPVPYRIRLLCFSHMIIM